jgi:hypothetical protein
MAGLEVTDMEFEWKEQFVDGRFADAAACGNRILELWNLNGKIEKEDIVVDAENENSPFRPMIFRESDEEAARKHRLALAGDIIRSIHVVSYGNSGEKIVTRLVEKLSIITHESNAVVERNTYVPINVIMERPTLLTQLLKGLDRTIDEYQQKRDRLKAYASANACVMGELKTRDDRVRRIVREANSEDVEKATIRESKIVEKTEEDLAPGAGQGQVESTLAPVSESQTVRPEQASPAVPQKGPKIPHSEDEFILQLRSEGKLYREIHEALQAKGIVCTLDDVTARYTSEKKKRTASQAQPKTSLEPSRPAAEVSKVESHANPSGPLKESKPEPKFISRHALADKVWEMHKAGKTPNEISDELCAEGYYYGRDRVKRMLIQQGAKL